MEVFLVFNLRRNVMYFCNTFMCPSPQVVSALTTRFLLTMVVSGFSPYHYLRPDNAPAECAGVTPTPWALMPMLSFVSNHQGQELLVTPPTTYLLVLPLPRCRRLCRNAATATA
jgi:hypothetical protein